MSLTVKQLLTFKRALRDFSRELCDEAHSEELAALYYEYTDSLQSEVDILLHQVRRDYGRKKVAKKATKKVRKKSGRK